MALNITVELLPKYPVNLIEGVGIAIEKSNGNTEISLDFSSVDTINDADLATALVLIQQDDGSFGKTTILDAVGDAVAEAEAAAALAQAAADAAASVGGSAVPDYATRDTAAAASIPAARQYTRMTGVSTVNTAPDHNYKRVPAAPLSTISYRSTDRFLPNGNTDNTNGGYHLISQPNLISSIAGTNQAAIQAVIDAYTYASTLSITPTSDCARIANGSFATSSTIHVGYGDTFLKGVLKGMGSTYVGSTTGSTLVPSFSDAPVVNIQGARRSKVEGFSITGPNKSWIESNALGRWAPDIDDTVLANWWDSSLDADGNSRYAPMAGICVDGFSGTAPSPAYPTQTYPSWTGISTQYSKARSSDVTIDDLDITGCAVGIVVQPSGVDGNGDFIRTSRVRIAQCVYGISICNAQSRNMTIREVDVAEVYTAFTSFTHGLQSGRIGEIIDCHVGNSINLIDLGSTPINGPCQIRGLYTELCWRIGNIRGSSSSTESVIFDGCKISLDAQDISQQIAGAGTAAKGVPASCLSRTATNDSVMFRGGSVVGYHRVFTIFGGSAGAVTIEGTRLEPSSDPTDLYEKVAMHSSCGGLIISNFGASTNIMKTRPKIEPKFTSYNASTGASITQVYLREAFPGSRDLLTPGYAKYHYGATDSANHGRVGETAPRVTLCTLVSSSPGTSTATASLSGDTLTLTFSGRADWQFWAQGFDTGDILVHDATGSVFFVSGRSGQVVTAVLQNNFRDTGSGNEAIDVPTLTSGTIYCMNTRLYTPKSLYFGDFTSGSSTVSNVVRWNGTCAIESDVADGDYLFTALELGLVTTQANGFVTGRSTSGKTITLAGNAAVTQTRVPLWNWFRAI